MKNLLKHIFELFNKPRRFQLQFFDEDRSEFITTLNFFKSEEHFKKWYMKNGLCHGHQYKPYLVNLDTEFKLDVINYFVRK